ncbi:MAG: lipopolysaccharide biosynthesis protein [Bacteroidales bacterium]|nr:lipopolysaccharide biosynthesis protein [Bacteroidales bacterium]
MHNLSRIALSGILWSTIERFSTQLASFIITIIVARKLSPQDYGLVAMLGIFMAIAQTFVDSGFSNALIQKQDRNDAEFSTVFWFNIITSLAMYCIMVLISPFVAQFYGQPLLKRIIPAFSLTLVIGALSAIQRTRLIISLDFKSLARIAITSTILSGMLAIHLANRGYGVWTLVAQSISNSAIQGIILWYRCKWRPLFLFSANSFRSLFPFGSKLLASGLLHTIYTDLYTLFIGKLFSASSLGLFTNARKLSSMPSTNISGILSKVMYPIMCRVQADPEDLAKKVLKMVELSSFFIFPAMAGLSILAEPVITLLLGEKWAGSVPFVRIISLAYVWDCIMVFLGNAVNARGKSDYFFRAEIWKKIAAVTLLLVSIPFGINGMCWSLVLYSLADIFIITRYTRRTMPLLTLRNVVKCIIPVLLHTLLMGSAIITFTRFTKSPLLQLSGGTIIGIIIYVSSIYLLNNKKFNQLCKIISYR